MDNLISRRALCDNLREYKVHPIPISSDESEVKGYNDGIDLAISVIAGFPSAQPEIKPIEYRDCADAMLRMWMDKVITDGEYNRIMDKLNAYWSTENG